MDKFLSASIPDVRRLCEYDYYDYIIVGSGIGGGVLAQSLHSNDPKSKILIIERGGTVFSSHCLNGPRPHWSHNIPHGPSQDIDLVFHALKESVNTVTQSSHPYVGGQFYCLGGKGNVWGLYTPPVHPEQLKAYFPKEVCSYLLENGGYDRAYRLLSNDPQASLERPYPDNGAVGTSAVDKIRSVISKLDEGTKEWGSAFSNCPLAAEFATRSPEASLYQYTMGAYSPVSWILDRVYNRDERVTVLPNTRVMTVNRETPDSEAISSITVLDSSGAEQVLPVGKAKVILSAGTLGSPSIALRSGLGEGCRPAAPSGTLIGRGLSDHDIFGTRFEILQGPHLASLDSQPLKLNTWVKLGEEHVLVNIAVNADTFNARTQDRMPAVYLDEGLREVGEEKFNEELKKEGVSKSVVQAAFCMTALLHDENRVLNMPGDGTTVEIQTVKDNSEYIPQMQRLAQDIGLALARPGGGAESLPPLPPVGKAGFGVVGHEVGTLRMGTEDKGVVDVNLKVNGLENLYACDLSVFPVSPAANPTLTLVALAQRLGDHLVSKA